VVPFVRGRERSRAFKDILEEIKQLAEKGICSVTLLGQNVNSYNGGCSFPELLKKINDVKGLKEISFVTSHPKDASVELFEAMRDLTKVKKYLHLPIQSGSDRILKLMNRGYTREHYLDLVRQYRDIVGEKAVLGTDIIVGFPSETEQDFEDSRAVIEQVKFDFAYIFKYSIRTKTKAAELADDVVEEEKKRRHRILLDLQKEISTGGRCVHC
jgi:tRNA-2-methylthio-N6-dimethylallyladenosine synthase